MNDAFILFPRCVIFWIHVACMFYSLHIIVTIPNVYEKVIMLFLSGKSWCDVVQMGSSGSFENPHHSRPSCLGEIKQQQVSSLTCEIPVSRQSWMQQQYSSISRSKLKQIAIVSLIYWFIVLHHNNNVKKKSTTVFYWNKIYQINGVAKVIKSISGKDYSSVRLALPPYCCRPWPLIVASKE
jgi:hypothetical protein